MTDEGRPKGLKKIANGKWWDLGTAMLYRDDVEKIYGLFEGLHDTVTLRVGGYELTSLADIAQVPSTVTKDLKISFMHPPTYASFEADTVRRGHFGYYVADQDDLALVGLCEAVRRIVDKRRLWPHRLLPYYLLILPPFLNLLVPRHTPLDWLLTAASLIGFLIFGVVIAMDIRNELTRAGTVVLRDSTSKQSFSQAHHDLLFALLGSVLTLAVTIVGTVAAYVMLINLGMLSKP